MLAGHKEEVVSASFDPSGKMILTASRDGTARLWRPEFEPQLGELGKHVGRAFVSREPGRAPCCECGERTESFRCSAPEAGSSRPCEPRSSHRCALHDRWKRLVAAADDGSVMVWRVPTGVPSERFTMSSPIRFAAVSRDGRRLVTGADDRTVTVWGPAYGFLQELLRASISTPRVRLHSRAESTERQFSGRSAGPQAARAAPRRRRVAGGLQPRRIARRDGGRGSHGSSVAKTSTGAPLQTLGDNPEVLSAISFSRDSKRVVTAGADGQVRTWRVSERLPARDIPRTCRDRHPGSVR